MKKELKHLIGDPIVRVTVAVSLVTAIIYAFPLLSDDALFEYSEIYAEIPFLLMALLAVGWGMRKIESKDTRWAWQWFFGGLFAWLAAIACNFALWPWIDSTWGRLLQDFLFLIFYVSIFVFVETLPHLPEHTAANRQRGRYFVRMGSALFASGLFVYFVIIPSLLSPESYSTLLPSLYLFLAFDIYLLCRFAALVSTTKVLQWQTIYGLFAATFLLFLIGDTWEVFYWADVFDLPAGVWTDILWYLPYVCIILAARLLHFPSISSPKEESRIVPSIEESMRSKGRLLPYVLVFPVAHLGLYSLQLLDPSIRQVRDAFVFSWLLVLGVLALFYHFILEAQNRKLLANWQKTEENLRYLASYDPLTRLPNRHYFLNHLQESMTRARRNRQILAIVFIDLDYFKQVNDSLGHVAGDQLLQQVAARLKKCFRETDIVARHGGDEFVGFLEGLSDPLESMKVIERIYKAIGNEYTLGANSVQITASLGISTFPDDGDEGELLIQMADAAMYKSKLKGRNTYQFHASAMNAAVFETARLRQELKKAVDHDTLRLDYEAIVDPKAGHVFCLEAKPGWSLPNRGPIDADELFQIAAQTGQTAALTEWMLDKAMRQSLLWQTEGIEPIQLAINIMPELLKTKSFLSIVRRASRRTGLNLNTLTFEIPESVLLENLAATKHTLGQLRSLGIHLRVDHFGTGNASINTLARFPVDSLKIDSSWVCELPWDQHAVNFVAAIMAMAAELNVDVYADGLTNVDQWQFFRSQNCRGLQGSQFGGLLSSANVRQTLAGRRSIKFAGEDTSEVDSLI